jgi:Putative transposase/Transposase zinc-binding domain
MTERKLELADIFRSLDASFLDALPVAQRRVVEDILACRTAALGGHLTQCDQCGYQQIAYNSCRDRHCPKCQAAARAEWMQARADELLPIEYFHLVFTLPEQLSALALQNKRVIYDLLFRATSETLLEIAADPQHLGARIGFFAVLHSWGQTMQFHPHLHCVIPGGGLSADNSQWIACRPGFFLPVKVLSRLFRGKFIAYLSKAREDNQLTYARQLSHLAEVDEFNSWLRQLWEVEWVVYAKPPFGGPQQVLKYLARYTHRVAISNGRLLELNDGWVTFSYKDYAAGNEIKTMTLETQEFARRFLLHVLPRGFVRMRYYGFLANRRRAEKLELCRRLLSTQQPDGESMTETPKDGQQIDPPAAHTICPNCSQGKMIIIEKISAEKCLDMNLVFPVPAANTS